MRNLELALKAAGDPTRARILKLLEAGPLCVCQIQAVLGLAPSTVSKHLTTLKIAGLAEDRRDGRWIHYTLTTAGRNPYAAGVLALLKGTPDKDPTILADRRRLREVRAIPIDELCGVLPLPRTELPPRRLQRSKPGERRHA
jgi:arsenate reductase/ArsR family transcriptional regulator